MSLRKVSGEKLKILNRKQTSIFESIEGFITSLIEYRTHFQCLLEMSRLESTLPPSYIPKDTDYCILTSSTVVENSIWIYCKLKIGEDLALQMIKFIGMAKLDLPQSSSFSSSREMLCKALNSTEFPNDSTELGHTWLTITGLHRMHTCLTSRSRSPSNHRIPLQS